MYSQDAIRRTSKRVSQTNHSIKIIRSNERSRYCRSDQQVPLFTERRHPKPPLPRPEYVWRNCQRALTYRLCSAIANALFRDARRIANGCADGGTPRLIAGRMAIAVLTAEQELGHHAKVVRLAREFSAWFSRFGDNDDLDSLQIKRIESLLELKRFDEAKRKLEELQQKVLPPLVQFSLQLLTVRLRQLQANGAEIPLGQAETILSNKPVLKQIFVEIIRSTAELARAKAVRANGQSKRIPR